MPTPASPAADIPDPRTLQDDLAKALSVLLRAKISGTPWVSAAEISRVLRAQYGLPLHWRRIETLLSQDRDLADRTRRGGRRVFAIMSEGEKLLSRTGAPIKLVEPERAVEAVLSLHAFLSGLAGTVRICDPYLDASTVEHLDACPSSCEIRLLTKNVRDSGRLRRLLAAILTQGRRLEIRVAGVEPLHDRYIIDDRRMLILGTSLNGFGKKQCFVISVGEDIRAIMLSTFDGIWDTAQPWL